MTNGSALSAQRLLERGCAELAAAGVSNPRFEVELLLRHALGCSRESLLARLHEPVPAESSGHFFQLVERRRSRVPIQHILGTQDFFGLTFRVTPAVLIPRPETEGVVEETLSELRSQDATIADVGCGSGCIAVALAHELASASILAIDASPAALAVARENARSHGVSHRIQFLHGDLLEPVLEAGRSLDAVVSNPPYVAEGEIAALEPEVSVHEPTMALSGGEDGLRVILRLLRQASDVLEPDGLLTMEIGKDQDARVSGLVREAGFELVRIARDLSGIPRVVVARKS